MSSAASVVSFLKILAGKIGYFLVNSSLIIADTRRQIPKTNVTRTNDDDHALLLAPTSDRVDKRKVVVNMEQNSQGMKS
ncbi:hypothetical protein NEOLI_002595 [Neolecta irregularis DAH-3]|uniref:Uncharacterized protein n=1 Tax=Neolecta irregularis (strain DAH-3) TaxID=1198029 RepID=A0A1U7LIQ7_NEOID|nr:hypothetical protein NEOLI_002595 [Neolecta irregularis DAH-3]|eukprot:OLL22535.1 hypothetical protein NEOLI_002595 [Neolecta irregularis DAH-3]